MPDICILVRESQVSIQTHSFSGRSLMAYPDLVQAISQVKKACARANAENGEISSSDLRQIERATDQLVADPTHEYFTIDVFQGGGGIAIHMALNEAISDLSGVDVDLINLSQSTTDVLLTSLNLVLRDRHLDFSEKLEALCATFLEKAKIWNEVPVVARTCMRKASVSTLGNLVTGYALAIQRMMENFDTKSRAFRYMALGGTAIGIGDGASDDYRRAIHRILPQIYPDVSWRPLLTDNVQNVDEWIGYSHELSNLSGLLIKVAKDFRMLSMEEDSEIAVIELPKVIKGSSFYKNKNNPTQPETLMQAAFLVNGWNRSMELGQLHGELQYNSFIPFIGILMLDQITVSANAVNNFHLHCLAKTRLLNKVPGAKW